MLRKSLILPFLLVMWPTMLWAQTAEIYPLVLSRIPNIDVASGKFWQQLRLVLAAADAPADSSVVVHLPPEIGIDDSNGNGRYDDEIRVQYEAANGEDPQFFVALTTDKKRIVLGHNQHAGNGGRLYIQFPIVGVDSTIKETTQYGRILFADPRELDIQQGPLVNFVGVDGFSLLGAMNAVVWAPEFATGNDTTTAPLGAFFPEPAAAVIFEVADLVFDGGGSDSNVLLGFGDGDDSNDVEYRFFWTTRALNDQVVESESIEALKADGTPFTVRENQIQEVQLQTSGLAAGVYSLLVTSSVTGNLPLGRSRPIVVRHQPQIQLLEPAVVDIILDSGALLDRTGQPTGTGEVNIDLAFQVVDLDDTARVHLFYSKIADLDLDNLIGTPSQIDSLDGATAISAPEGIHRAQGVQNWNIGTPDLVAAGDYFIYAVATDGKAATLQRSVYQIKVRHSPFLRLDALNDAVLSGADTIITGGERPQRFVSISWGRSGSDGDMDVDNDARIDLFHSLIPAQTTENEGFSLPGGAADVLAAVGGETHLIASALAEDPDRRIDNQFIWDLWGLENSDLVPKAASVHYLYGVIGDGQSRYLAQMNGGRINDAAARLVFVHPPTLRPLQPLTDILLERNHSVRVAWEDMDLDSDAHIRILLTSEDYGEWSDYATLTAGTAYVVNSVDGMAASGVDIEHDLSEDSTKDYYDVRVDHLSRSVGGSIGFSPGAYHVYLAIEDSSVFDAQTLAWKTPGLIQVAVEGEGEITEPTSLTNEQTLKIYPEVFSLGTGGSVQAFEVRVNAGGVAVDLVAATLTLDGNVFSVVDQDDKVEGIQAFRVGTDFNPAKLFPNEPQVNEDGTIQLQFEYLEPIAASIPHLDGEHTLGVMELVALEVAGSAEILLEVETDGGGASRLENDGNIVLIPPGGVISRGSLVPGRATMSGIVDLEGRLDKSAVVDFSIRRWASYVRLEDRRFIDANDIDLERDGVQVLLTADGGFELVEVPTGRLDLFVHLDGYLEAWAGGLNVYPDQVYTAVRPVSQTEAPGGQMLGGDVAGYLALDGSSQPDNQVTLADWDFLAAFFGFDETKLGSDLRADITGDGLVNVQDLALVGANFLSNGPRPVFKELKRPAGLAELTLIATSTVMMKDEEKVFHLSGDGFEEMQAFEVGLGFYAEEWEVVEVATNGMLELWKPFKANGDADLETGIDGGVLAASWRGRETYRSTDTALAIWRLRALVDQPQRPWLIDGILVDQAGRAVKVHLAATANDKVIPLGFSLQQNKPNPFNSMTTIDFSVPIDQHRLRLEIYNTLGQRIATLWDGPLAAGIHQMVWNGRDQVGKNVASGVYHYQLHGDRVRQVRRMVLLR